MASVKLTCALHLLLSPWANQSLPAGEVLLALGQDLLLDAAERSYAWRRMQKPDSLTGIYLVEARVHVGGRDEEVLQALSVHAGRKNFPSKLLGKVPAHVFTAEMKLWLFFFKAGTGLPVGYWPAKRFGCVSCSWRTNLRTAEVKNV